MCRRLVAPALALALAAALTGCGDDGGDDRRQAVAEYIRAVNTTQQRFAVVYADADSALRAFGAKGSMGPQAADELADAVATMRDVRGALAEIDAPAEARRLRTQLLRLLDLQTTLTLDLSKMARYLPRAAAALRVAEAAQTTLQQALGTADTVPAQAAAARAYGKAIGRSLDDVRQVTPPAVLAAWHRGQVELLSTSAELGVALAGALESGDRTRIEHVLERFRKVSRDAAAVARAQVLAVRSFNDRVKEQRALVRKIVQEERRLDNATS